MSPKRSTKRRVVRPRPHTTISNGLLTALPRPNLRRVMSLLDAVPLPVKKILHRSGKRINYVYFPRDGFVSELILLESGEMVEVATIGREGMVGIFAGANSQIAPSVSMVQGSMVTCYRMSAKAFRREMDRRDGFFDLMNRYMHAHMGVIMQSTACNAMHTAEQRLARWLLMAHDRMACNEFPLTQEVVAMMLGVARPTVSMVAGTLQQAGLLTYRRGQVTILDRQKLESMSCECYRVATLLLRSVVIT